MARLPGLPEDEAPGLRQTVFPKKRELPRQAPVPKQAPRADRVNAESRTGTARGKTPQATKKTPSGNAVAKGGLRKALGRLGAAGAAFSAYDAGVASDPEGNREFTPDIVNRGVDAGVRFIDDKLGGRIEDDETRSQFSNINQTVGQYIKDLSGAGARTLKNLFSNDLTGSDIPEERDLRSVIPQKGTGFIQREDGTIITLDTRGQPQQGLRAASASPSQPVLPESERITNDVLSNRTGFIQGGLRAASARRQERQSKLDELATASSTNAALQQDFENRLAVANLGLDAERLDLDAITARADADASGIETAEKAAEFAANPENSVVVLDAAINEPDSRLGQLGRAKVFSVLSEVSNSFFNILSPGGRDASEIFGFLPFIPGGDEVNFGSLDFSQLELDGTNIVHKRTGERIAEIADVAAEDEGVAAVLEEYFYRSAQEERRRGVGNVR